MSYNRVAVWFYESSFRKAYEDSYKGCPGLPFGCLSGFDFKGLYMGCFKRSYGFRAAFFHKFDTNSRSRAWGVGFTETPKPSQFRTLHETFLGSL